MTIEKRFDEEDFNGFLNQLLNMQHLEDPALGITRQVEDQGYESLSDKQKYAFKTQVLDVFYTEECERCSQPVPWSEMYNAYDNGGYCGWCSHMMEKDD